MRQRDSRALITSAALAEFAQHGYAGARVERIAHRAGVNKQLVFYYFGSKAGLYQTVLEGAAGEATAQVSQKPALQPAVEQLRKAFAELFDGLAHRPDLTRLILLDAQQTIGPPTASRRAFAHLLIPVRQVIAEGQGYGYFRDEVDPDRAAQQAVVLALGFFAFQNVLEDPPEPARAQRWRDDTADLLLRALSW